MNNDTFQFNLDALLTLDVGSPAFDAAWDALVWWGSEVQVDVAGTALANRCLGEGAWHFEGGGEIAVSTDRARVLNYCADGGPRLLEGADAAALLAWYAHAAEVKPAYDVEGVGIDMSEGDEAHEDDHFTPGCPSRA